MAPAQPPAPALAAGPSLKFPAKLAPLFEPHRYKVAYGGRGGAKSWGFARALLVLGEERPLRILCARELQTSIKDSVHKLLADQISELGLSYEVQERLIRNALGTEFLFEGIRHNVNKIKSTEGIDICWVEEAQSVSKPSWDVLIPTVRKEGSEIWVSFNPDLEKDETYKRFITNTPPDTVLIPISWRDNEWFPDTLRREMEHLKLTDYDAYLNVWEGHPRVALEGAVYAQELRDAIAAGRICDVPRDATVAVHTFWDLGFSDHTSIWFAQRVGFQYRVIDYYSNRLKGFDHYLSVLQQKGYLYDTLWLPHDARAKELGTGRTIEELARAKGHRVRIVPNHRIADGINAARTLFPSIWFDKTKCEAGLDGLKNYRYELDKESGTFSKNPVHDWASHPADSFRYLAMGLSGPKQSQEAILSKLKGHLRLPKAPRFADALGSSNGGWLR